MKKTGYVGEIKNEKAELTNRQITCEVTGEMVDGTKVWTNIENENEQFYCRRFKEIKGVNFFFYL